MRDLHRERASEALTAVQEEDKSAMNVQELIEELSILNSNAEVVVFSDDMASRTITRVGGGETEDMPVCLYVPMTDD